MRSNCIIAALLFGALGCGGSKGTLSVKILTPPGPDDPFLQATQVRMTVGDNTSTTAVMDGRFNVKIEIEEPPQDSYVRLSLEALDLSGQVVGRGRSPGFVLVPENSEITVYVGRPGRVTGTEVTLQNSANQPAGRSDMSGAALRGRAVTPQPERALGALLLGGVDEAGNAEPSAWLYDPLTHKLVSAGKPEIPRRGAALVPETDADQGQQAILWGGAPISAAVEGDLPTAAQVFDPNMSSLATVFRPASMEVAEGGMPGAVAMTVAEVQSGVFLASGGRDRKVGMADKALNQAVLLQRFPAPEMASDKRTRPGVKRLLPPAGQDGPMAAARLGHSATPVALPEGAGLLLFGGLAAGDNKPVAEVFSLARSEFRPLALATESRRGHVAAPLRDGRVLVVGGIGLDNGMTAVLDSALLIDARNLQVSLRAAVLSVPRHGAKANLLGDEIVICGGFDKDGKALASCEFLSADSAMRTRDAVPMPTARGGHLQLLLETDQLLLVGGIGEGGKLPAAIDLYSPLR